MTVLSKVDHSAIRTNQALIIGLNFLAFILNVPELAGFVGLVMLVGTIFKRPGFAAFYIRVLRPSGVLKPDVVEDNPEPHRFAQGFGSLVVLGGVFALFFGLNMLGWSLIWVVIALAALNLFGGFCVGCAMYYWLNRLEVPGFVKSPPPETVPGMRPRTDEE